LRIWRRERVQESPHGLTPGVPPFALRAIAFGNVRSGILPAQ